SASGLVMNDSNGGNNYAITYVPSAATGVITAANVTLAGTRVYDGTANFTAPAFGTFNTGVGGETLTIASGFGTVPSPNAGPAQTLTPNTLVLGNGSGSASNYTIALAGNTGTITPVTPPVPPQTSTNNLDGLINPILVGMQSLGIGVPPGEESSDCMVGDNNFGVAVVDGVAVSVPHRCVPAIPD
ncbi:MAG: YDG domain-containing protein, partial [Burkholderiales bacterium]